MIILNNSWRWSLCFSRRIFSSRLDSLNQWQMTNAMELLNRTATHSLLTNYICDLKIQKRNIWPPIRSVCKYRTFYWKLLHKTLSLSLFFRILCRWKRSGRQRTSQNIFIWIRLIRKNNHRKQTKKSSTVERLFMCLCRKNLPTRYFTVLRVLGSDWRASKIVGYSQNVMIF